MTTRSACASNLVRPHAKTVEIGVAKGCGQRDIDGVAAPRHQNPPDPRRVEARIEGVPLMIEIHFKPCAEVHRGRHRWYSDIAEIARGVARGDAHAAAKCNRQMVEITADARAFSEDVERTFCRASELISKTNVLMHPVANGLHARPAHRRRAK